MTEGLYCKVYVTDPQGRLDGAAFKAIVSSATGASFEGRAVRVGGLLMEVFDHHMPPSSPSAATDFVRWPVVLELEPEHAGVSRAAFVAALASCLNALNQRGLRTVASGDVEDELAEAQGSLGAP